MTATAPDHRATALRAYFIWEGEGRPHGRHELHWFAAEAAELRAAEPVTIAQAVPAKKAAIAKAPAAKRVAGPKAAAPKPKKDAPAKAAAPKAPAHAVVAAAALAEARTARSTAKGARRAH